MTNIYISTTPFPERVQCGKILRGSLPNGVWFAVDKCYPWDTQTFIRAVDGGNYVVEEYPNCARRELWEFASANNIVLSTVPFTTALYLTQGVYLGEYLRARKGGKE
jgi:hypothetical protein